MREITVSAIVMQDDAGRVLNVRKRGTTMLMLPGGKPEAGETPATTALREFAEELGVPLSPALLTPLGVFHSTAANEAHHTLVAHVFNHPFVSGVQASAEIDLIEWVDPRSDRADLAPLTLEHVFPRLRTATDTDTGTKIVGNLTSGAGSST